MNMEFEMQKEHDRVNRISSVLIKAFLQFRLATWHTHIRNVEQRDNFLILRDDPIGIYRDNGWWALFLDIIVALKDPANTAALLATKSCYDLAHMTKLTEQLFEGMDMQMEEVVLRLKPIQRRTVITYDTAHIDFNDDDFWVLRLTSRATGQTWALHLAGAQYYMSSAVSFWTDFSDKWVHKILGVRPLGTLERYAAALAQTMSTAGLEADVQMRAMQAWHGAVDPAMMKKGLSWKTVLDKNEEDFARHYEKILRAGRKAVDELRRATKLNKRRLKAKRYEKRHADWVEEAIKNSEEVMQYKPWPMEFKASGYTWLVSGHDQPQLDRVDVSRLKE